jgi:hypothetical protein
MIIKKLYFKNNIDIIQLKIIKIKLIIYRVNSNFFNQL